MVPSASTVLSPAPPAAVPPGDGAGTARSADGRWAVWLTLLFFCVAAFGIAHHEMWRDELQAWMIARDSGSLAQLFDNIRYEGHPAGWYLVLWVLSRFTRDPIAMQGLHLVIATASVYLLARFAPLPWLYKVLLAFGYFLAYEYAVISRSYALGALALFTFCALYPVWRRHPLAVSVVLGVLANTSVYGAILALAAGAMLLAEAAHSAEVRRALVAQRGLVVLAVAVVLVSIGSSVLQMMPPPDAVFFGSPVRSADDLLRRDLGVTSWRVLMAYVPLPNFSDPHFWSTHFYPYDGYPSTLYPLPPLAAGLLAASALLLVGRPLVLLLYGVGTSGLLLFTYLFLAGTMRHHGHLFVLFVACLWLAALPSASWTWTPPAWLRRWSGLHAAWAPAFVVAVLLAQVVAAAHAYTQDLRRPFSRAREVAQFLRAQQLDRLPIAASDGPPASAVAALLDRPFFYLNTGGVGTFMRWNQPDSYSPDKAFSSERLRQFLEFAGPDAVLVLTYPFPDVDIDLQVTKLAHFPAGIQASEHFRIYRVTRREP